MAQAAQLLRLSQVRAAVTSGEAQYLRETAHLSIGEVARACGVDQSTVWRWERGTRRPRGTAALAYGELIDSLRRAAPETRGASSEAATTKHSETPAVAPAEVSVEHTSSA